MPPIEEPIDKRVLWAREVRDEIFYANEHELEDGMNWVIPGKLIAGHYLGSPDEGNSLKKLNTIISIGVKTIIDLTTEADKLAPYEANIPNIPNNENVKRYRFPIKDGSANNDPQVLAAVASALVAMRAANGGVVYVHCWGGHGRTGVVVSIILGQYLKISADMALYITSVTHATRPYQKQQGPSSSPQTIDQLAQVRKLLASIGSVEDANVYATTARRLFSIYKIGYAPPDWVIKFMNMPSYVDYARRARCYSMDNRAGAICKLLLERQPVNISMNLSGYSTQAMYSTFGFGRDVSGYTDLIQAQTKPIGERRLPPNISVYCYTPVRSGDGKQEVMRHVINSVGVALDTEYQPDFQVLFAKPAPVWNSTIPPPSWLLEIRRIIREAYHCLLACAQDLGLKKIAICHLGGGVFSDKYPGGKDAYINQVWLPVVSTLLNEQGKFIVEVMLLGALDNMSPGVKQLQLQVKCNVKAGGQIPSSAFALGSEHVLFQNAWDPHSICGNGNSKDKSLDGFFGRSSAISVLSFPPTNPFINFIKVSTN
jgi:hypothetical protein